MEVFLDSEQAIEDAIAYVVQNPIDEGMRAQCWNFVKPFGGLEAAWTTYHD
jgi:hypothetical protein